MNVSLFSCESQTLLFPKKEMYVMEHMQNGKSRILSRLPKVVLRKCTEDNMHLIDRVPFKNGLPQVAAYNDRIDYEFVAFSDRYKCDGRNQAVHLFQDDYRFSGIVWNRLERTTIFLSKFDCVFAPDFSMWRNLPTEFYNKKNVFRSRFVAAYWQSCGFNVIPVASWGGFESFEFCFEGLPKNSIIGVCGVGNHRSIDDFKYWCFGLQRLEEAKRPTLIIIYGAEVVVPGIHTPLMFIPDYITTHFRKNG